MGSVYIYIDNEPEDDLSEAETVLIYQFDDLFNSFSPT
jgi:hypothetical protein